MLQSAADIPTSFAGRFDRVAERTIAPHWAARLTARLRARQLDRQLIAGADPARSRQLAARACLLTSSQNRTTLALALERLLVSACEPANFWGVAPLRRAVLDRADELIGLASLLRSNSPLYARGIAMVGRLLSDGTGPAYVGPAEALDERLWQARRALTA
ncbi:MAG TPA: hypothetical protein VGH45_02895 [Solirubrobacteraceae bacterium]|jgi:hypothetical protein